MRSRPPRSSTFEYSQGWLTFIRPSAGPRYGHAGLEKERTQGCGEAIVLRQQVEPRSEAVPLEIEGERRDPRRLGLAVDGRVAAPQAADEPRAPFPVRTVAPRHVQLAAAACDRTVIEGDTRQILARTFGNHVDHAPDSTVRSDPRECRRGALQDFDALGIVGEDTQARRDAVDPVEGDLAAGPLVDGKAADGERVEGRARRLRGPDGGIEDECLGDGARLLVPDEAVRVARDVERRFRRVDIAEQTDPSPPCDLAPGIGGGQA